MKINFIGAALFRSGGMRIIFEYASRLTEKGHDVIFYYPSKPYRTHRDGSIEEIKRVYWGLKQFSKRGKVNIVPYNYNFKIKIVPVINNYFIRKADFTFATQWQTAYSLNSLSSNKGIKVYFIQDYENWDAEAELLDKTYLMDFKRITVSAYLKDLLFSKFGVDSSVILNSVDYSLFNDSNKVYNMIPRITFISYEIEKKGVRFVIDVIKKIKNKYPNVEFICFGLKKTNILPEFVNFIENPIDDRIAEIYKSSDIFLFPSLVEGFALPPAEAMACKCAVVTTKVGAVPDYSVHMESAIHVEPGNVNKLYDGVNYLLENESEIHRISENAYKYVREKLNWDESVKRFEKCLLSAKYDYKQ